MKFIIRDSRPVPVPSASCSPVSGTCPAELHRCFRDIVESEPSFEPDKELLVVFCFNVRLALKGWHLVSLGSLNECLVGVREVLRPVLVTGSCGFALAHNHPSGDPGPSDADRRITRRLQEAAWLMDLRLLDHLVIGRSEGDSEPYFSFREHGLL